MKDIASGTDHESQQAGQEHGGDENLPGLCEVTSNSFFLPFYQCSRR